MRLMKVIDRGLVRTGRAARTGRKNIPKEEGEHSKNKHKENSEVAALRKKFEVEIEIEPESAQIARTKPRNRSTIWKKTNPIKVKNESSKNRQALSNNSPKSPSVKRLNQSKMNRTSAKPKLLTLKLEKTLNRFEKLLHDLELSTSKILTSAV